MSSTRRSGFRRRRDRLFVYGWRSPCSPSVEEEDDQAGGTDGEHNINGDRPGVKPIERGTVVRPVVVRDREAAPALKLNTTGAGHRHIHQEQEDVPGHD